MTFDLIKDEHLYGITKDKNVAEKVVDCVHETAAGAISEWRHFETLNTTGGQFLDHKLTKEEIRDFEILLQTQYTTCS